MSAPVSILDTSSVKGNGTVGGNSKLRCKSKTCTTHIQGSTKGIGDRLALSVRGDNEEPVGVVGIDTNDGEIVRDGDSVGDSLSIGVCNSVTNADRGSYVPVLIGVVVKLQNTTL